MPKPPVKAQNLADQIAERIRSGDIAVGAWLPPERTLAETHGVVRSTARDAIQMLVSAGLVERVHGSGTRVLGTAGPTAEDRPAAGLDAAAVHSELAAIHAQLREIGDRLSVIEERTGASEESGR